MSSSSSSSSTSSVPPMAGHYAHRDRLEYELTVRQEPKQARMCGVGGKADRRPIDPPPIVQLRVIDPLATCTSSRGKHPSPSGRTSTDSDDDEDEPMDDGEQERERDSPSHRGRDRNQSRDNDDRDMDRDRERDRERDKERERERDAAAAYAQSYLQNPYYFMFASLAKPDDDTELHWLKDGRTRCTTGSVVSSLYHLKDPQHNNEDAGFFVFPDLSVRTEGSYRLKLSLFEVVGNNVQHCKSIFSAPFYVYTAKKFPGMEESTPLSCSLADQGIKIRIRKDIRVRKRPNPSLELPVSSQTDDRETNRGRRGDDDDDDDDAHGMDHDRDDERRDEGEGGGRRRGNASTNGGSSHRGRPAPKRLRTEDHREPSFSPSTSTTSPHNGMGTNAALGTDVGVPIGSAPIVVPQQHPWPPVASHDPTLGPTIPPPAPSGTITPPLQPMNTASGGGQGQQVIPPPPGASGSTMIPPPPAPVASGQGQGQLQQRQQPMIPPPAASGQQIIPPPPGATVVGAGQQQVVPPSSMAVSGQGQQQQPQMISPTVPSTSVPPPGTSTTSSVVAPHAGPSSATPGDPNAMMTPTAVYDGNRATGIPAAASYQYDYSAPPPPTQQPQQYPPPGSYPPPPPPHLAHQQQQHPAQHQHHPPPPHAHSHYAQYPNQGWGAPPPPPPPVQQQMYDPYAGHYQHQQMPPPHHPHQPPPMSMHHPHYAPPAHMHLRYDYSTGMYAPPPPPLSHPHVMPPPPPPQGPYGYYDQHQHQHQQHQHLPPPPQASPYGTVAAIATGSSASISPGGTGVTSGDSHTTPTPARAIPTNNVHPSHSTPHSAHIHTSGTGGNSLSPMQTSGYGDYPYSGAGAGAVRVPSPIPQAQPQSQLQAQPRGYGPHTHTQSPYYPPPPPPMHPHHQQAQHQQQPQPQLQHQHQALQRQYAPPPPYSGYSGGYAPPPGPTGTSANDQWGAPTFSTQNTAIGAGAFNGGGTWDVYNGQNQGQPTSAGSGSGGSVSPSGASTGGLMGHAVGAGDRIQLAPLRVDEGGYGVGVRSGMSSVRDERRDAGERERHWERETWERGGRERDREGGVILGERERERDGWEIERERAGGRGRGSQRERERDGDGDSLRERGDRGKKNLLSIGSIISNE